MGKILQNVKIKILCKLTAVCSIYNKVLFCTGIDLDDIMQIDCWLISILFSIAFQWSVTAFGIV